MTMPKPSRHTTVHFRPAPMGIVAFIKPPITVSQPMKISSLQLHSIAIADPPLRSSYGLHAPWALRTIVELETDDGVRGVSESYGGERPRAALEDIRGRVVGMDPFQLAGLYGDINREA